MPDEDIFQRTFAPLWRPVYRMAEGGVASEGELGAACVRALARTLRKAGGFPELNDVAKIVDDAKKERDAQPLFAAGGLISASESFRLLRELEMRSGGHRVTKVGARAARTLLSQPNGSGERCDSASSSETLAERTCFDLADHHFFGRSRGYLVHRRFGNFEKERDWEHLVKEKMEEYGLKKLARQLVNKPDAKGLRVPKNARIRKSTAEILNEFVIG